MLEATLSKGERQPLEALAAAMANGLLVLFVLAVALPLLPPNLADLFWLLAFYRDLLHQWLPGPAGGATAAPGGGLGA